MVRFVESDHPRIVEGLPAAESEALLTSFLALATRPERIYAHRWQAGDLLVWDNASMMHKALPPADGATKKTYRITNKVWTGL